MRLSQREAYPGYEQELLAAAPPIDSTMEMVIQALRDLEGERQLGFGVAGFIPFRAVRSWAEFHAIDRDLTAMLLAAIQKLDNDRAEREAAKRALEGKG